MNPERAPHSKPTTEWDMLSEAVPFAGEIPTTSPNPTCAAFLRGIERFNHRMNDVKTFIQENQNREYKTFTTDSEIADFSDTYASAISQTLTNDEKSALKYYSGYNYRLVNQVARGQWNYDLLGEQTPEKLANAQTAIAELSDAINAAPSPDLDFATYRGTNLESFLGYNVNSLSDLNKLQGQFFLESGFTSSTLDPEKSFTDYDFDDPLRKPCDIKMKILVPKETTEVVGLLSDDTCYNEQKEILFDKSSLFYIKSVHQNPAESQAELEMLLIPQNVYDPQP